MWKDLSEFHNLRLGTKEHLTSLCSKKELSDYRLKFSATDVYVLNSVFSKGIMNIDKDTVLHVIHTAHYQYMYNYIFQISSKEVNFLTITKSGNKCTSNLY